MRFSDAIIGIVLLAFGSAVVIYSQGFPGLPGQNYGPAFFPSIIGFALGGCGVLLIVQGILKRREMALVTLGDWASSPRHRANFVIVILALLFYVLVSKPLGFIPTSLLITTFLMVRFGVRLQPAVLMAAVSTLVIHTAFYKLLLVPLPWGILKQLAW